MEKGKHSLCLEPLERERVGVRDEVEIVTDTGASKCWHRGGRACGGWE